MEHALDTPWGPAEKVELVALGVIEVSTASHGGIMVTPGMVNEMPLILRTIAPWAGAGWYEEDCDANIVVAAFPRLFPALRVWHATNFLRATKGIKPSDLPDATAVAEHFEREHADHYVPGCMSTSGKGWTVSAHRIKDKHRVLLQCAETPSGLFKLDDVIAAGAVVLPSRAEA